MGWTSGTVASSLFTGQKDVLNFLWTVDGNAGHVWTIEVHLLGSNTL